jgi:DNA polymerase I-like protein with 3'-5' exonuclease and polymerase domains
MSLWTLFRDVLVPAQGVLMRLECRGMRVDTRVLQQVRADSERARDEAIARVQQEATVLHARKRDELTATLAAMESAREEAKAQKRETKTSHTPGIQRQRTLLRQHGEAFRLTDASWRWLLFDALGLKPPPRTKTPTGLQQVGDDVFDLLQQLYPDVEILKWRGQAAHEQKRLSTFLNMRVDAHGYHHPQYSLHRTATCRVASGKDESDSAKERSEAFNIQNLPEEDRRVFVGDSPGDVVVASDWSQIQALMLAYAGQEAGMAKLIRAGDIHTENSKILAAAAGLPIPKDKAEAEALIFPGTRQSLRKMSKPMSYGFWFLMEAGKFALTTGIDKKAAQRIIDATRETYPGMKRLWDKVREEVESTGRLRNGWGLVQWFYDFAKKGGKWRLSDAGLREAVAWLIQSSEAMMCLESLPTVEQDAECLHGRLMTTTHDSFVFSGGPTPIVLAQLICEEMQRSRPQLGTLAGEPFWCKAEVKVGASWGEVK